jgi:hypothetical protein
MLSSDIAVHETLGVRVVQGQADLARHAQGETDRLRSGVARQDRPAAEYSIAM